ncbi:MAG: hypothetical protein AAGA48_00635 [Myxococcota bacterium]
MTRNQGWGRLCMGGLLAAGLVSSSFAKAQACSDGEDSTALGTGFCTLTPWVLDDGDNIAFIGTAWELVGTGGQTSPAIPTQRFQLGGTGAQIPTAPLYNQGPHHPYICWRDVTGTFHLDALTDTECLSDTNSGRSLGIAVEAGDGDDQVIIMGHPSTPGPLAGTLMYPDSVVCPGFTGPSGGPVVISTLNTPGGSMGILGGLSAGSFGWARHRTNIIWGQSGEDTLVGGEQNDVLSSNDHLFPRSECVGPNDGEDDLLCGQGGSDLLVGETDMATDCLDGGDFPFVGSTDTCFEGNDDFAMGCESPLAATTPPGARLSSCTFRGAPLLSCCESVVSPDPLVIAPICTGAVDTALFGPMGWCSSTFGATCP